MRLFGIVFFFLLSYIVAALLFWGFSLQRQSRIIYHQELAVLRSSVDSSVQPEYYRGKLADLERRRSARTKQYLGEGGTFLAIILAGAGVVFTSFRRSLRLSRQQNNFMLAVTHELKSPIAAIKLNTETLLRRRLSEQQQGQLLGRSLSETDRLNDLCNNMLIASQMEGRQYKAARELVDLSALLQQSLDTYRLRYPGRFEEGGLSDEVEIDGDRLLLGMALSNLVENALKYTPAGTPIRVSLRRQKGLAVLQVCDEGPGIPDGEKEKIFGKFYRIGDEATRKTKGTGLGLYLTAKIVKQHKGRITVRDNKPQGAIFQISLPAADTR